MKKILGIVLSSVIIIVGCTKGPEEIHVSSINLSLTSITLDEDQSETLVATISPASAENKNVTWTSDKSDVAIVDNNGKVTAVQAGTATIIVTTEDGGKTATCNVTVIAHAAGVSLNKTEMTLDEGQNETLVATISPASAENKNVTWTSDKSDVAIVDNNGKVTAVKAGTATITVTTEDGGKTATCKVTVIARVSNISLNKTEMTLDEGQSETLVATIVPDNATNKNVSWKSDKSDVATVDNNGKVTAVQAGTATIIVTTEDGGKTATCNVTVIAHASGVSLNKTEMTLDEGQSETLVATIAPASAENKNVTWTSDKSDVAIVDNNGKVTAVKAGTATITVTTEDGCKTATCKVTVIARVSNVSLNKTEMTLDEGQSETLVATIVPDNATNKNVSWTSDKSDVATVDNNGKVTAVKAGTATITVTTEDGGKTAICLITVLPIPVTSVILDKVSVSLKAGETVTLNATVNPENASDKKITWSTSDASVATVNEGVVTALKVGTAIITAKAGDKTAICTITVEVTPVTNVSLDKKNIKLYEGKTAKITATVTPENATYKDVEWLSENNVIATVEDGLITAISRGKTTITAKCGDKSDCCEITVLGEEDLNLTQDIRLSFYGSSTTVSTGGVSYGLGFRITNNSPVDVDLVEIGTTNFQSIGKKLASGKSIEQWLYFRYNVRPKITLRFKFNDKIYEVYLQNY